MFRITRPLFVLLYGLLPFLAVASVTTGVGVRCAIFLRHQQYGAAEWWWRFAILIYRLLLQTGLFSLHSQTNSVAIYVIDLKIPKVSDRQRFAHPKQTWR